MAVKIRLSRIGKKKTPSYRIVAVDSRKKRDGAYLENLGTYDAIKGIIIALKQDRIDYWIGTGAIATDSVKKLLKRNKKSLTEPVEKKVKKTKIDKEVAVKETKETA